MSGWISRGWIGKIKLVDCILFFAITFFGIFYINYIWNDQKKERSFHAIQLARSVEAVLSKDHIQKLTAIPSDTTRAEYKLIKAKLHRVIEVNPITRFAYLYLLRDGKLFFMVDSEPENSSEMSPPGQEFTEASEVDFQPFKDGKPQITKPVTDRWGTWVSTEVPVKDEKTGEIIAVLGIDCNSSTWNWRIAMAVFESCFLVVVTLILLVVILFSRSQNRSLRVEIKNRETAEDRLMETELILFNLIKNLPGMVYRCALDQNYSLTFIGEACTRITGYTPDEFIIQKTMSFNDLICPEYRESIVSKWLEQVVIDQKIFEEEYPIYTASGETKWLWERSRGVLDENGELQFLEGYIEDITESKKNKAELIKAKEKAEESDRLKSSFLANISHEIRTPMNGILGFAELLNEPDLSSENQKEFIDLIGKSGQRMLNIINDLVDISKIEAGETTLRIRKTNINRMLRELHLFFKPEADQKTLMINYHCDLSDESSFIETDDQKLNQILSNLIKNSIKFTDQGSITFGYKRQNSTLEFYVTDTGSGIAAEHKKIIFDRFRQGTLHLTRKHEGAGLGLAISKAYVELLGGELGVESDLGIGSTFRFNLHFNMQNN